MTRQQYSYRPSENVHDRVPKAKKCGPIQEEDPRGQGHPPELLAVTSRRGLTDVHETPEFGTK